MFYLQVIQAVSAIYSSRYGLSVAHPGGAGLPPAVIRQRGGAAFEYRLGAGQSSDQGVAQA
ncbi:MAG: hypothetical protein ACJAWL_002947 [Motiliproteus sp.]|jgi:hypothetical protein